MADLTPDHAWLAGFGWGWLHAAACLSMVAALWTGWLLLAAFGGLCLGFAFLVILAVLDP